MKKRSSFLLVVGFGLSWIGLLIGAPTFAQVQSDYDYNTWIALPPEARKLAWLREHFDENDGGRNLRQYGDMYFAGLDDADPNTDPEKAGQEIAINAWKLASNRGNSAAMLSLFEAYRDGAKIGRDCARARDWILFAIATGDPLAPDALRKAAASQPDICVPEWTVQDASETPEQRVEHLRFLAGQGLVPAVVALGDLAADGVGMPRDPRKAIAYWNQAAGLKSGTGLYRLGHAHILGNLIPRDCARGVELYDAALDGLEHTRWVSDQRRPWISAAKNAYCVRGKKDTGRPAPQASMVVEGNSAATGVPPILGPTDLLRQDAMAASALKGGEAKRRAAEAAKAAKKAARDATVARKRQEASQGDLAGANGTAPASPGSAPSTTGSAPVSEPGGPSDAATARNGNRDALPGSAAGPSDADEIEKRVLAQTPFTLTPEAIAFLGAFVAPFLAACDLDLSSEDVVELAPLAQGGMAMGLAFGADFSNPDPLATWASAARTSALMLAGHDAAKRVGCGAPTDTRILTFIAGLVRESRSGPGSDTFVKICAPVLTETKCACASRIAMPVIPDIATRPYTRELIGDVIGRNPMIGLQLVVECGIQRY